MRSVEFLVERLRRTLKPEWPSLTTSETAETICYLERLTQTEKALDVAVKALEHICATAEGLAEFQAYEALAEIKRLIAGETGGEG